MRCIIGTFLLLTAAVPFLAASIELDVQGHRGCRGLLPENSMAAFERALELGVTTLEMDIQSTRDGVLVVYHDQRLSKKRCKAPKKATRYALYTLDYETIKDIDCGTRRPSGFPEQERVPAPVPRLTDVLERVRDASYPVRISVEIKLQDPTLAPTSKVLAERLVRDIKEYGLVDRAIVQSFLAESLQVVEDLEPALETSILVRERSNYDKALTESGASILSPKYGGLREADVRRYQERGLKVIPWTVNAPADIERMIDWGVDGIISDYPDRVLEILRKRQGGAP